MKAKKKFEKALNKKGLFKVLVNGKEVCKGSAYGAETWKQFAEANGHKVEILEERL